MIPVPLICLIFQTLPVDIFCIHNIGIRNLGIS